MENSNIICRETPPLLRISPEDNVWVAARTLDVGTMIEVAGESIPLGIRVGLGHKIAARDLAAGEKIVKYNVPIGSATTAIKAGEWVHLHNMKSDYLPTYLRGKDADKAHGH
jgi:hypothetical protein